MKNWSNILILVLAASFILSQLLPIPYLVIIYTILTIVIILLSLIQSGGLSKSFGMIMLMTGSLIMIVQNQPIDAWMEGITKNLPLVCLIILVPVLGIPIHLGNYDTKLVGLTTKFKGKSHLIYLFISGLYLTFAPLINMGSVSIIDSMLKKLNLPKEILGRAYIRGFTSVHTWSPYFASVFLVVYSLQIPISHYLPYGLILSGFQVLTGYLLFVFIESKYIPIGKLEGTPFNDSKKLIELFAVIFLLIGLVFSFEQLVNINASVLIVLIVVIFSVIWSLYLKEIKGFYINFKKFRSSIIPAQANEVNLLLTAGFFAYTLSGTSITKYINSWWGGVAEISVFLLIIVTIVFISFLSFIGVHQIVSVSAIIATVSYEQFGIHVITMAMMLLSSWAIATTVSLVSPVNIIIANTVKTNIFKLIFRWNILYTGTITIIHTIVIYVIHLALTS